MKYESKIKWITNTFIFIGIIIRIMMAFNHFTHIDDNGAMNDLMRMKLEGWSALRSSYRFWTYAPLQLFFSALLVNYNFSYKTDIFLGRLPSLICGITVLFFLILILDRHLILNNENDKDETIIGEIELFVISLCAFSWENIIYSAQAEPYEIVVLVGLIVYFVLLFDICDNWRKSAFSVVVLVICCYAHFQALIEVFSLYATLLVVFVKSREWYKLKKLLVVGIANFILVVPELIMMFKAGSINMGVNWNKGIGERFFFQYPADDILSKCIYTLRFFLENTYLIIRYFFTIKDFKVLGAVIAAFFCILILIGFLYIHKHKMKFAVFTDAMIIVNIILITFGKLTYGPSRHMIYIFPFMLLLLSYGIFAVWKVFRYEHKDKVLRLLTVTLFLMFMLSVPNEFIQRKNYVSEEEINDICEEYNPDFVWGAVGMSDLYGMEIHGYDDRSSTWRYGLFVKNSDDERSGKFVLINRSEDVNKIFSNSKRKEDFEMAVESIGYEQVMRGFPDYKLLYKKEIVSGEEVEYASRYYSNNGNGHYLYVYEYAE